MTREQNRPSRPLRFWGWVRRHWIISGAVAAFWLFIILVATLAPKQDDTASPSTATATASASPTVSPTTTLTATPAATTPPATTPPATTEPPAAAPVTQQPAAPATRPAQAPPAPVEQAPPPASEAPSSVYYANCTAARNAGAAPILQGEPGYRPPLDRDHDGIACETD